MDPNDGYKYNNNGSRNGITYFKYIKARTHFCNGSIKRLENGTFVMVKPHRGHGREQGINNQGLISNFRAVLKQRAATENIPLKSIYDEESRRHVVAAELYPWSTADSIMRFTRRSTMPILPNSLSDFIILSSLELLKVQYLSYLGGNNINCSMKRILMKLFTDNLLSLFSYNGKKGKKKFCDLIICPVIFDAVKCQSKFMNVSQNELENRIKYHLAQAPFNIKKKTINLD